VKENIHHLLEKYSRNACTKEELHIIEAWFIETGTENEGAFLSDERVESILNKLKSSPQFSEKYISDEATQKRIVTIKFRRLANLLSIAATLLIFCGITFYLMKENTYPKDVIMTDIAPGGNQAYLTLSDGTKIALSDTTSGRIAEQQGVQITNEGTGTLVYSMNFNATDPNTLSFPSNAYDYNTIETPRGGQYQIILPDGSTAWLNASSSITFPVQFSSSERKVKVTGEVYFDIATQYQNTDQKKRTPFLVETSKQTIEVLGTQFNVNDYQNDQMEVTLVTGRVKLVSKGTNKDVFLSPGQQAHVRNQINVIQADMEEALAWKNGDFIFKNEKLETILEQVSRWYDIDINCPAHLASLKFSGMVSRKRPLSSILAMLESTGTIKAIREGRRSIVIE